MIHNMYMKAHSFHLPSPSTPTQTSNMAKSKAWICHLNSAWCINQNKHEYNCWLSGLMMGLGIYRRTQPLTPLQHKQHILIYKGVDDHIYMNCFLCKNLWVFISFHFHFVPPPDTNTATPAAAKWRDSLILLFLSWFLYYNSSSKPA